MADKGGDRLSGNKGQEPGQDRPRPFINEKIVRQPVTKRQIARRILLTVFCAVLFGVLSAVCFVVSRPVAEKNFRTEVYGGEYTDHHSKG